LSSTKNNIFRFKQFEVDQSGCAMKINTDGTLLGVLSNKDNASSILDIGTGTGVVAMMLAQRYPEAIVDAVEIDIHAASTADKNFKNSIFADRLSLYASSFQQFSEGFPEKRYDLIVSNPPFFLNSLKNPDLKKQTARHADDNFFGQLIDYAKSHLSTDGLLVLILPLGTAKDVIAAAAGEGVYLTEIINIKSFDHSEPHRQLLVFGRMKSNLNESGFVIYSIQRTYSVEFVNKLREFFLIF